MIALKAFVSTETNLFIFVGEICGLRNNPWSSIRRREWISRTGGRLNKEELYFKRLLLSLFISVPVEPIEACFLAHEGKDLKASLAEYFSKKDINNLFLCLRFFKSRFLLIWKEDRRRLLRMARLLNQRSKNFSSALSNILRLLGYENLKKPSLKLPAHIVLSSKNKDDILGWFSALGSRLDVVLEYSHAANAQKDNFACAVLLHEAFHFLLRNSKKTERIILNASKKHSALLSGIVSNMPPAELLTEILISVYAPEGYLANRYFDIRVPEMKQRHIGDKERGGLVWLRRYAAYHAAPVAQEYCDSKKAIDDIFIHHLIQILEKGRRLR